MVGIRYEKSIKDAIKKGQGTTEREFPGPFCIKITR